MPVFLRPAIKIPQNGDRCYVQGASSLEDSISSLGATRENFYAANRARETSASRGRGPQESSFRGLTMALAPSEPCGTGGCF